MGMDKGRPTEGPGHGAAAPSELYTRSLFGIFGILNLSLLGETFGPKEHFRAHEFSNLENASCWHARCLRAARGARHESMSLAGHSAGAGLIRISCNQVVYLLRSQHYF